MEPKFTIAIISLIIIVILLVTTFRKKNSYPLPSISATTGVKPVVMIIIDSLMDLPLLEAIHSDKAPALKFLKEKGQYFPRMVTSFPTMSVCIDTTILTGVRPNQHHIFGLTFLHRKENRVINFGTGPKETFAFGLKQFLADSMLNLNQQFLNKDVKTIHEEYEGQTASINAVIYRGNKALYSTPLVGQLLRSVTKKN
jgi:predicted AlkP superfamily pyrophosphatase or phosphodiesterase